VGTNLIIQLNKCYIKAFRFFSMGKYISNRKIRSAPEDSRFFDFKNKTAWRMHDKTRKFGILKIS